jgi:hypothetical protein
VILPRVVSAIATGMLEIPSALSAISPGASQQWRAGPQYGVASMPMIAAGGDTTLIVIGMSGK